MGEHEIHYIYSYIPICIWGVKMNSFSVTDLLNDANTDQAKATEDHFSSRKP